MISDNLQVYLLHLLTQPSKVKSRQGRGGGVATMSPKVLTVHELDALYKKDLPSNSIEQE